MLDTVCAAISQAPVEGASYQDCARAEAKRLEDIKSPPHAGVEVYLQSVADRFGDGGECLDAGGCAVELPAAVVRDDDAVNAVLGALYSILDSANALNDERQACEVAQPVEPVPGEPNVVGRRPVREVGNAYISTVDEVRPVAEAAPVQAGLCHIEVADVALLWAADRGVNSKTDCLVACLLGALDENLGYLVVLVVELEPERARCDLSDLFDTVA